ncbi:MAG TPA: hypothetical protein VEW69_03285 [Alphaproteobacteria bacterium]|nr:hypothetical protein [Alphaproteobacteria bacterium]
MTDAEMLTLVHKLEQCQLANDAFHHRDHLAVAIVYLYAMDLPEAIEKMRSTLMRFAAHHDKAGLYHHTLTVFWATQVEGYIDRSLCLGDSAKRVFAQLNDKDMVYQWYSKERLFSPEARASWVPSDRKPV